MFFTDLKLTRFIVTKIIAFYRLEKRLKQSHEMDNLSGRLTSKVDQQKALLSTDNKARIYSIEVYIVLQEPKHVTNRFISKR